MFMGMIGGLEIRALPLVMYVVNVNITYLVKGASLILTRRAEWVRSAATTHGA